MQRLMFLLLLLINAVAVASQDKYALVIGNSKYVTSPLRNPVNDASDIAAKLKTLGFNVIRLLDADQRQMESAIRKFSHLLHGDNKVGLFYFAGHGVESKGRNYLMPIDAEVELEADLKYEAVDAGRILDGMNEAGNGLNMVILDACRNNPYARSFRGSSRGLVKMEAPKGSLLMYATSPGDVAADGKGRNGVFTQHLLAALDEPGLKPYEVFTLTAKNVIEATGDAQKPYIEGYITGEFYFQIKPRNAEVSATVQEDKNDFKTEQSIWQAMNQCGTPDCYRAYLQRYPDGVYQLAAEGLLAKLDSSVSTSASVQNSGKSEESILLALTVKPSPVDARVRILNIGPKYYDGIELEPGRYHLEITKPGYEYHKKWFELNKNQQVYTYKLRPLEKPIGSKDSKQRIYKPEMVLIPGGSFLMGSNDGDSDEKPIHRVTIKTFEMGKYEVTKGQFRDFIRDTSYRTDAEKNAVFRKQGCFSYIGNEQLAWKAGTNWRKPGFTQDENEPVVCVSYRDVKAYLKWLNKKTGKQYRLPSEAEWEFAARAGSGEKYSFDDSEAQICDYANSADLSLKSNFTTWTVNNECRDKHVFTAQVGTYHPNRFGLYDMHGNVWEWTEDCWNDSYEGAPKSGQAWLSGECDMRVMRGGSWVNNPAYLRFTNRKSLFSDIRSGYSGFRLSRTLAP